MSLSSDEINLLIQHYLQEFGYDHSAFAFGAESKIPLNKQINCRYVPPGSLVYLIQKGIMLSQIAQSAESMLPSPNMVNNEINNLKTSMHQSSELNQETAHATKVLNLRPNPEKIETAPQEFYLSNQCSLFLEGHNKPALFASWIKNSSLLATTSADGNVILWRFDNENSLVFDDPTVFRPCPIGEPPDITAVCWQNSEKILAVGTYMGVIVLYKDKSEICRFTSHNSPIVSLCFAPKSKLLSSVSADGVVLITDNGETKYQWKLDGPISDIIWYRSNYLFVSSNKSLFSLAIDKQTSEKVVEMKGEIVQITISHSSRYLAVGDDTGNLTIVDKHRKVICSHNNLHDLSICSISAAKNSDSFVTGGCDGFIKLVNVKQQEPTVFDGHARAAYLVAFDPKDRFIASAGADRTVSIWGIESNQIAYRFIVKDPVNYMVWSPNGKFLTICLHSGQVSLIDFDNIDQ